ncbi:cell division protein ZipA [Colwellia sp. 12G3]|uniref:cell division protein ZipA n=1 Tax=Colwellia sp. 12G3 TaxID=2058299 RepID=UPI000C31BB04|nr:cell division protein ZipA [Colwellia sp. 12G3]PKI16880.1 cell division protein ZipA [Colwellia sp. 12G3]
MEDNFRNVLIILSAIVITAIFIHGLWIIRKQKNPYKLKASKDKIDPITRDFDRKGFDQDGVGQVKVKPNGQSDKINLENKAVAAHVVNTGIHLPDDLSKSQILIKNDVLADISVQATAEKAKIIDISSTNALDDSLEDDWFKEDNSAQFSKEELGDELTPVNRPSYGNSEPKSMERKERVYVEPLYEQPVTQAKPTREPTNNIKKTSSKASLKRDQIEIDFDNQNSTPVTAPEKGKTRLEPQVIILSVVMPANQQMFGAALLPSLLTLGLKYGEMNIFHRHEDNAGNGKVTFSLANIMNPGSFDLDSMETFATRGVSLFMTLPNAGDSLAVFEQMLNAAKQLAQEFNAQVIDDKRNVMTKQTEQHYLGKIREFDRKSRISLVE